MLTASYRLCSACTVYLRVAIYTRDAAWQAGMTGGTRGAKVWNATALVSGVRGMTRRSAGAQHAESGPHGRDRGSGSWAAAHVRAGRRA
jgi:hypothetical protein